MTGFLLSASSRLVRSPRSFFIISLWLLVLLGVVLLALVLVPWQQTVIGTGRVTVFSPMHRPQNLEAQIPARLEEWKVVEGQHVKKGQMIAKLSDIDPKFLDANQIRNLQEQQKALLARRDAAESRITSLRLQEKALSQSKLAAIPAAGQKVVQNQENQLAASQALDTARFNYKRIQDLYQQGLRSRRDYELAELDLIRAETGLRQARAQVSTSRFDQDKVSGDTSAAVANVSASIASAYETIAGINSDLAKLTVEIENLKQRKAQQFIIAPMDGRVVRLLQVGSGETVSEGEVLATLVPNSEDQAVELYISAWDVPLVSEGRLVRLQFAGWPAIQFAGWPMIATGTFGGRVSVIDAVDDGMGKYRILVQPDKQAIQKGEDQAWPSPQFLRPGAEAQGWILLDTVPLGYELWRQFNAFPPSLKAKPEETTKPTKPVKRKTKK
ncbi:MAG: HlyD family secretion protein [Candidatus Melainabacteria bacterium]